MKLRSRSSRVYHRLLRLFPSEFRGDFGDDMSQVFDDERREAAAGGRVALARLWVRTIRGIAGVASREHLNVLTRDAGYAARLMWHDRLATAAIIVTLALGTGATAAMFTVIKSVMLGLPFRDPSRLVVILRKLPRVTSAGIPPAQYGTWSKQSGAFESIAALWSLSPVATGTGETRRLAIECVSPNMFSMLGVAPMTGRTFTEEEGLDAGLSLIVISHAFWTQSFGRDPAAIGRAITLDGLPSRIVGTMPAAFESARGRRQQDGWITLSDCARRIQREGRIMPFVNLYARLGTGATPGVAAAQLESTLEQKGSPSEPIRIVLEPLTDQLYGEVRDPLLALQGAALFVLAIGCANIASLLLGRAETRRRELAMRFALGCTRARMIRQLLTESVVLAVLGSAAGLVCAHWSLEWLRSLIPGWVPRADHIAVDRGVLLAGLGMSIAVGVAFGLLPAWYASNISPGPILKGTMTAGGPGRSRARTVLIVAELALSVAILAGAGLVFRTFLHLRPVDPGFDPRGKLTVTVNLPRSRYTSANAWATFYKAFSSKLSDLPGVRAVASTTYLPLSGFISTADVEMDGSLTSKPLVVGTPIVTPNYLREMAIRLVRGRELTDDDRAGAPEVALVNEAMARRLWPASDPLGRTIRIQILDRWSTKTIVGVVHDTRSVGFRLNGDPEIFVPFAQNPTSLQRFVLTTALPINVIAPLVKGLVADIDSALPAGDVEQVTEATTIRAVAQWRFAGTLMGAFAMMALVLAAVGLFALVGRSVIERTPEIGVRIALGASRADVLRLFVGNGARLCTLGLAFGIALGGLTTRFLATWLVDTSPLDGLTFAAASALMAAVCLSATYGAARHATRIDPLAALRRE